MGRCIIKLTEGKRSWYLEWSTIVDAPITYGMSLSQFQRHIKDRYGSEGLNELPARLARVEEHGTSAHCDASEVDTAWLNRAGKGETRLTYTEMVKMYCHSTRPEIIGHACDYSSKDTPCSKDECWSPEIFDDRGKAK